MASPTLLDLFNLAAGDQFAGIIDEAARATPEVNGVANVMAKPVQIPNVGAARTIPGTGYSTTVRTALPGGAFRNANEGTTNAKSTYEKRAVECAIFNPRWSADKAVAQAHPDGTAAFVALEAQAILQGALQSLASQFYYGRGTGGDAKGHPGLIDMVQSAYVVDAGGTTANTGSSVWAVKFGPQNVIWCFGRDGGLEVSAAREETAYDASDNPYTAIVQEILGYVGLQMGHGASVGRIKKVTADSGKTLTDDMLSDLLALFPTNIMPDAIFMSRRSRKQLQQSRTATTVTGAAAPTPTEYEGIPIVCTDNISDTEALTL